MSRLLYIQASPRTESYSTAVAEKFLETYQKTHSTDDIVRWKIFEKNLPSFDGAALQAKYRIFNGRDHSPEEAAAWRSVEAVIEDFKSFDKYVFSLPMWNFGVPYRLKHLIDVLTQPGLTFRFSPQEGYSGLVTGKPALVVCARGGAYPEGGEGAAYDFQLPYMKLFLGFIGFTDIRTLTIEPTLAEGPETARRRMDEAMEQAVGAAADF